MPSHHTRLHHRMRPHRNLLRLRHLAEPSRSRDRLIGDTEDHVDGEALDLQQAVPLGTPVKIFAGTYKDAAASSIVIMTVGTPAKFSGSRLDMLAGNVGIVRGCIQKLMAEAFDGALLIAMNPVDVLTFIAQKESGLPASQVIGSGTLLDTERLRQILGERLNVDPRSVHAAVIGEHGDSSVAAWSAAHVAGVPLPLYPGADNLPSQEELLTSVRHAGPEVASLKGNTCFAIASCVTRICEAIHTARTCLRSASASECTGTSHLHSHLQAASVRRSARL